MLRTHYGVRQDLPCTYLAQHDLDNAIICYHYCYGQGYQLGPSQLDFAITITVTSAKASGGTLVETLTLDPSNPYVLDDANLVSAQLLGDLLTYTALPVFTDTYLMVPSPTGLCVFHVCRLLVHCMIPWLGIMSQFLLVGEWSSVIYILASYPYTQSIVYVLVSAGSVILNAACSTQLSRQSQSCKRHFCHPGRC